MSLLIGQPFSKLAGYKRVLVAGAGGGFDIFAGVPLALALQAAGAEVVLANLSFTYLGGTDAPMIFPYTYRVEADAEGEPNYFPERVLAEWLQSRQIQIPLYAFDKVGVQPIRAAYRHLIKAHNIEAIVLTDGGTDLLMRGDESGLGTPHEDIVSLTAMHKISEVAKFAVCIGFGIDTFHGVCHAHFLENVASLTQAGGFFGTRSLLASEPEGEAYLDLVNFSAQRTPTRPSIVNLSIASAMEGYFGNHHRTSRTSSSELFINPLMNMYWAFDLDQLARHNLYLDRLEHTTSMQEVNRQIIAYRSETTLRPEIKSLPM